MKWFAGLLGFLWVRDNLGGCGGCLVQLAWFAGLFTFCSLLFYVLTGGQYAT